MAESKIKETFTGKIISNPLPVVAILLLINFLLRILIWSNTELYRFEDYKIYLAGFDRLVSGQHQDLLEGNLRFGISYIAFFCYRYLNTLDTFFILNCLIASITGLIIYYLVVKLTNNNLAGILTLVFLTIYTEFMVFSSVFYSPVIMVFLLSLLLLLLYFYSVNRNKIIIISSGAGIILIFILTFFFKPDLYYFPFFLFVFSFIFIKKNRLFFFRLLTISFLLISANIMMDISGVISRQPNHTYSNSFIFFGHTDYGGDGGEGAFIYPENEKRYQIALEEYCSVNSITEPDTRDYNNFHKQEVIKFITNHPVKWIGLQLTKFFRTFGVVPEGTSFKVLFTGLLKGRLWLTSIVTVAPVALILLLLISFFNFYSIKKLFNSTVPSALQQSDPAPRTSLPNGFFLYICFLLFIYYLIASVFYGQYQERYRIPVIVIFIIPLLSYFISVFRVEVFLNRTSLFIKAGLIIVFLSVWINQTCRALGNRDRFQNAIESVELLTGK